MGGAPSGVGSALAQPGHQHVAGAGGDGEERVIAALTGVVVALGSLLGQAVGLAHGGVQIYGQRVISRTGASRPGSGQRLPAHPVQLPHVAPPEAAQEGPQGGRRLDHAAQHWFGAASTQRVGIINAISPSQRRRHQRQYLIASVGSPRGLAQVNVAVHQLAQAKMMGQSHRQGQPGIGHQAMIVEGDIDAVGLLGW